VTVVHKNIGYELRSAPPAAWDLEYVRDLGFGAVEYLVGDVSPETTGAMIVVEDRRLRFMDFAEMRDPATGKTRVRRVDLNSTSYRVARQYMIRLQRSDFDDPAALARLAEAARMTPDSFRDRFGYLADL
jgi:6-phosphofructokinase 1